MLRFNQLVLILDFKIIINMSQSDQPPQLTGLTQCFDDFQGTYCVRKLVQLLVSLIMLVVGIVVLILFIYKYRVSKPYWLISIQSLLVATLLANIFFCFFNQQYWLYAIQNFFFNTYYLVLVGYVCYAYILKQKNEVPNQPIKRLQIRLNQENHNMNIQKIIFFCVVAVLLAMYLAIFIVSVVYEVQSQSNEFEDSTASSHYCEEIWYLVFNVICIVLSIVVVVIMLRGQQEEYKKIIKYNQDGDEKQGNSGSQKALTSKSLLSISLLGKNNKNMNNPFKNLWIWVGLNVISQICNLIQAGLYINAIPPQCLILSTNLSGSNIISLIFVFLTMYLGFCSTLWYIILVKLVRNKTGIDRSKFFSEEVRVQGNIELFLPSKQQTVITLI